MFFKFIWDNKVDKIKRNVMINKRELGGLEVPHIKTLCQSLKMVWIKKILDENKKGLWKKLLLVDIKKFGTEKCLYLKSEGLRQISSHVNSFWSNVLCIWSSLQTKLGLKDQHIILSQPIWYNNDLLIGGNTIFKQQWIEKEIFFINDLVDEDCNFLKTEEIRRQYNLNTHFLELNGILCAIPTPWKRAITDKRTLDSVVNNNISLINRAPKVNKPFYNILLDLTAEKPITVQTKWSTKLNTIIDVDIWNDCYLNIFRVTDDSNFQNFQFKLVHRIIYTNYRLFRCKMVEYTLCTFCNEDSETLEHLFFLLSMC